MLVKTVFPSSKIVPQIIGTPTDEEIGLQKIYPYHVCAGCGTGADEGIGKKLLICGKCKDRQYCSSAWQKKHWKLHKPICSRSKEDMEAFMSAIPLDWEESEKKNGFEAFTAVRM